MNRVYGIGLRRIFFMLLFCKLSKTIYLLWVPGMEFMYDVSTCTARIIGNRLDENGISLADWPHTNPI